MAELKALQSENESLKSKAAKEALGDVMDQVVEVKGVKLLAVSVDGVDMNGLRDLGDQLKGKLGEGVIVLASASDGKSQSGCHGDRRCDGARRTCRQSHQEHCG